MITDKIGAVAYKLQLPAGSRIHPVIHVSMLKKAVPQEAQVSIDIPPACNPETDMIAQPEQFLERRLVRTGDKVIMRVLVKWKGLAKSLATWEDLSLMHERFPDTLAWGQAISYGGGRCHDTSYSGCGGRAGPRKAHQEARQEAKPVKVVLGLAHSAM